MDKIKTVKIKNPDGSVSQETYTISVDAKDVDMSNGKDLQETIGTIDIDKDGSIAEQLGRCKNYDFEKAIILYKDEARDGNYGLSPIILPISIKNFSHYEVEYAYYLNGLHLKLTTGKLHSLHVFSGTQLRATEYTSTQKIEAIATLSVDADGNFSVWGTNIDKIDKNTGTHTFDTTPCFKITRITAYKSDLDVDYSS